MAAQPDYLLLEGLAKGDEAAFEALFLRYYSRVYAMAFRFLGDRDEADDIAQEVFLKLHAQRFGPGEQRLGGWLYRAATNLCLNRTRGEGRRQRHETSAAEEANRVSQGLAPDPATVALRGEERALVHRVLARLPERSRAILLLRQSGLTYAEVGEAVGVAASSVGTLLTRAEEKFRQEYLTLTGKEG